MLELFDLNGLMRKVRILRLWKAAGIKIGQKVKCIDD